MFILKKKLIVREKSSDEASKFNLQKKPKVTLSFQDSLNDENGEGITIMPAIRKIAPKIASSIVDTQIVRSSNYSEHLMLRGAVDKLKSSIAKDEEAAVDDDDSDSTSSSSSTASASTSSEKRAKKSSEKKGKSKSKKSGKEKKNSKEKKKKSKKKKASKSKH